MIRPNVSHSCFRIFSDTSSPLKSLQCRIKWENVSADSTPEPVLSLLLLITESSDNSLRPLLSSSIISSSNAFSESIKAPLVGTVAMRDIDDMEPRDGSSACSFESVMLGMEMTTDDFGECGRPSTPSESKLCFCTRNSSNHTL